MPTDNPGTLYRIPYFPGLPNFWETQPNHRQNSLLTGMHMESCKDLRVHTIQFDYMQDTVIFNIG
jgi:hypothetical protein